MTKAPVILGSKVYFAREAAGVSTASIRPADSSAVWVDLGYVRESSVERGSEDVELWVPSPGALRLAAVVPIKPALTYQFTLSEFGPRTVEILWGTAPLDDTSTSFVPLETLGSLTGWLRCEYYDHRDQRLVTVRNWVMLRPLEGLRADGQSFAELRCEARTLLSAYHLGSIHGTGEGGGGVVPTTWPVYWGKSTSETLDAAGILGLGSTNKSSAAGTYSYPAGDGYAYLCTPAAWSSPTAIMLSSLPLSTAYTAPYTTAHGDYWCALVTVSGVSYRVFRSDNTMAGSFDLNVS